MYRSVLTGVLVVRDKAATSLRCCLHIIPRDRSLSALSCMDYSVGRHKLWNGKYIDVA